MSNNTMKSPDSYSKSFLSDICRSFCNRLSILIKALAEIWLSEYYSILLTNPNVVVRGGGGGGEAARQLEYLIGCCFGKRVVPERGSPNFFS